VRLQNFEASIGISGKGYFFCLTDYAAVGFGQNQIVGHEFAQGSGIVMQLGFVPGVLECDNFRLDGARLCRQENRGKGQ
jgi:hypothetical protein